MDKTTFKEVFSVIDASRLVFEKNTKEVGLILSSIDTFPDPTYRLLMLGSGTEVSISKKETVSFDTISRKINKRSSGNQCKIVDSSKKNQPENNETSEIYQATINEQSTINQPEITETSENYQSNGNDKLVSIEYVVNRKAIILQKQINKVFDLKKQSHRFMVENLTKRINAGVALLDKKMLDEVKADIIKITNKQKGAQKARLQKRPEQTLREFKRQHKAAIGWLTKNRNIRKATRKFYRSFNKLPDNVPNQILNAITNAGIKNGSDLYTTATLTAVINRVKQYRKVRKTWIMFGIKYGSLVLGVLILFFYVRSLITAPTRPTDSKHEATVEQNEAETATQSDLNFEELIYKYKTSKGIQIWEMRHNKIIEALKIQNPKTEAEAMKIIAEVANRKVI